MFKVYKGDEFFKTVKTWREVLRFVGSCAGRDNYGEYGVWEKDGAFYFDCGSDVYKVVKED